MGCRSKVLVVGVIVLGGGVPVRARACSPPRGEVCTENVDVFVDIVERPTNACIVASWALAAAPGGGWDAAIDDAGAIEQPDAGPSDFAYVAPDGTVIALLPGALRCPERELEPFTEYAIVGPTSCGRGSPREHARFTTGAGPDTTRPTAPGEITVSCSWQSCDSGACCGPYTATILHSSWEPATDDSGVVLYGVGGLQRGAGTSGYEVTSGAVMFGQIYSGVGILRPGGRVGGIEAVDIAGNRSEPGPASPGCPARPDAAVDPSPPDAAVTDPSTDAGPSDPIRPVDASVTGPDTAPPSGGCSVRAHTDDERTLAAIGLLGVGLLAVSRSRRRSA